MEKRPKNIWLIVGLVLTCFCMRAPMSVVGPLVFQIKETLHLSSTFSGLLTAIPLLIFALVSPLAGRLLRYIRARRLFMCCIVAIFFGILLRSYCGFIGLLFGTALLGLGIGILNVLIPVWIRQEFPARIGPVMGLYSTAMTALSALAAGFCVSLSARLSGWQNTMALLAAFPVAAFSMWLALGPGGRPGAAAPVSPASTLAPSEPSPRVTKCFSNWCAALFMGLQSFLFFVLIAWLPSMLAERGSTASRGGMMVLVFQLVSLVTNFLMPVWFQKYPARRRWLAASCAIGYAAGILCLLLAKTELFLAVGVVVLGLASGLSLSFALTVIAVKGKTGEEAVKLSSFAQCVGYLVAAPAPVIIGALFDSTGSFALPLLLMLILCVPYGLFGIISVKDI